MTPKRIMIKLSGELLRSSKAETFSEDAVQKVADVLACVHREGIEFGVVIGAGNLFRGLNSAAVGVDRTVGDSVGMLGTVMNALVVREALRQKGITAHVMAPQHVSLLAEPVDAIQARKYLEQGEPVFFAGGTGNPFFTTDSAATLRALEVQASMLVKATKVQGVYSTDPVVDPCAQRYDTLTFDEVLMKNLRIMDQTSIALAREHKLSIFVYKFGEPFSVLEAMNTQGAGTYIVTRRE